MKTTQATIIKLDADSFARYKKLGAEKAALDREQKNIMANWEKASLLPEKNESNLDLPFVVVNGNGDEIGKITIYKCEEKTVAAFIARRVS